MATPAAGEPFLQIRDVDRFHSSFLLIASTA